MGNRSKKAWLIITLCWCLVPVLALASLLTLAGAAIADADNLWFLAIGYLSALAATGTALGAIHLQERWPR